LIWWLWFRSPHYELAAGCLELPFIVDGEDAEKVRRLNAIFWRDVKLTEHAEASS
jgi:hypothetical protein